MLLWYYLHPRTSMYNALFSFVNALEHCPLAVIPGLYMHPTPRRLSVFSL